MSAMMEPESVLETSERLVATLREYKSCVVAMSAGVDSAVVAQAAYLALGDRSIAVTAVSASLAAGELKTARHVARQIGIRHETVNTDELADPDYLRNAPDRCYRCKSELYTKLADVVARLGASVIANGANLDDLGDYRPGLQAAAERQVRSPLVECGIDKAGVRALAAYWNLPIWDKPASPCLSSRIAYGEEVTPARLAMIDGAEQWLRARGLSNVRVRYHRGDLARIEVLADAVEQIAQAETRTQLIAHFQSLGFKYVTLDLQGFSSGSQNRILPLVTLSAADIPDA